MVEIKYYANPADDVTITGEFKSVSDFLLANFTTRDEFLDLRFFDGELLGEEIQQDGGDFLDICDGTVSITHDSMIARGPATWIYVLITVAFTVATILLMPEIPPLTGRDQQSGTNALGQSNNEAHINQRIDDLFGTVSKHTPSLWQVPYRIGVNNQETEIMFVCVGRGKYDLQPDKWYDGDTPMNKIPNASVSAYAPHTHPGSGSPVMQIGPAITEKVGIYRKSNDLNPTDLRPPNDLSNAGLEWRLTGTGLPALTGVMTATVIPEGFDFTGSFTIGQKISFSNINYYGAKIQSQFLRFDQYGSPSPTFDVGTFTELVDLGAGNSIEYTVTAVTSNSITLSIPNTAPANVISAWSAMTNYNPPKTLIQLSGQSGYSVFTDETSRFGTYNFFGPWFRQIDATPTYEQIEVTVLRYTQLVGVPFANGVGPVFSPSGATEVILNFVSDNGFYKLDGSVEKAIACTLKVVIFELDSLGVETGNITPITVNHNSNTDDIRQSVFTTSRIVLPYANSKIFVERTTNRDKNEGISNVDNVKWRDFYSFEPVNLTDLGDVTTAHIVVPSNSQSQLVKNRRQNLDTTRLITQYMGNGVFGATESYATNQFDQILIHKALDPYIGRLTLEDINADGYLLTKQAMVDYFGGDQMCQFGHVFDTTAMTFQDAYMLICNVVMCLPYVQSGIYDLFFDRLQPTSSMQVTCRNKKFETETRKTNYDVKYDGVEIAYRDNLTSASETIYLPLNQSATNPERIELTGCTTKLQAFRYAHRVRERQIHQIEEVIFDVDDFGRNIIPGKRIDSPDSTRFTYHSGATDNGYRVYDGEVVDVDGLNVELSEPVSFTAGENHYITFTKRNGDNGTPILCTFVDNYTVKLNTLPTESIYDGYSLDRTKFILVSEQLKESVALIPRTIEFNLSDDGTETNTITSVNYSSKYYIHDLELP